MTDVIDQAVKGDLSGLPIAADARSLIDRGAGYLTQLFQHAGALTADNAVTGIVKASEFEGGSTGRKLLLEVRYRHQTPDLHHRLFVKFSRDADDQRRDQTRVQMHSEVRLALVSTSAAFPLRVPRCYFADYHQATGTGILITERVAFGEHGIEPLYPKSVDHRIPDVIEHYQAVMQALGTLAGCHRAGVLPDTVEQFFPFDPSLLVVNTSAPPGTEQIHAMIDRYDAFATEFPGLLPARLRQASLLESLRAWAPAVIAAGDRVFAELGSTADHIALCHWNAQLDNAWFWRTDNGQLACGLMDWGNVSQMNVAMALWGALCGAHAGVWEHELDQLIDCFVAAFEGAGAAPLNKPRLLRHLDLYIAYMGVRYMLDSPRLIRQRLPEGVDPTSIFDQPVQADERIRSQLAILTSFLIRWQTGDIQRHLLAITR